MKGLLDEKARMMMEGGEGDSEEIIEVLQENGEGKAQIEAVTAEAAEAVGTT